LVLREENSDGGVWFCVMSRRKKRVYREGEIVGFTIFPTIKFSSRKLRLTREQVWK